MSRLKLSSLPAIGLSLGILVGVSGPAHARTEKAGETPGDPRAGRNLFVNKGCFRCHSVWQSDSKKGPNLASLGMGRNLYDISAAVWSHWSQMNKALEQDKLRRIDLNASQFKDLIAYLYYLNYYAEPGDEKRGGEIFNEKGCARCHAREPLRDKGMQGRAVYEMVEFQGPVALAVALWNHGGSMVERMDAMGMRWPEFRENEVCDLVSYIRSRTGSQKNPEKMVPGDPGRGRSLFKSKSCAGCHVPGAAGPAAGRDLLSPGPAMSLSNLVGMLWNHYPRMSRTIKSSGMAYPRFSLMEMEDLVAYVYRSRAYGLQGNASSGERLYHSKQCASCHSRPGEKAESAPALVGSPAADSVYSLLAAIWNHGPKMESQLRERKLSWPSLSGEEIRDLVAYLRREAGGSGNQ